MTERDVEVAEVARGLRDLGFYEDAEGELLRRALAIVERFGAAKEEFIRDGREVLARVRRQVFKLVSPNHAHHFLVHLSSSSVDCWQATRMEGNEPTGHVLFNSSTDAIASVAGRFVRGVAPIGDASFALEVGKPASSLETRFGKGLARMLQNGAENS